jgi:hypothetical protein
MDNPSSQANLAAQPMKPTPVTPAAHAKLPPDFSLPASPLHRAERPRGD